jgi:SAM-dependent methyltransferase
MIKRLIRATVRFGLKDPRVRRLVAAELAANPAPTVAAKTAEEVTEGEGRSFVDRHGVSHPLDFGLRDKLKPAWRTMVDPVAIAAPPTDDALRAGARKAARVVDEAARLVATITGAPLGGIILEVGCYDGAAAYELARVDGRRVVASDMARFYVVQGPDGSGDADIEAQEVRLADLRERARVIAGVDPGRVAFVEDDITSSTLEPATFDAIVSFEVLEHVGRPTATFASMARLLKPGGIGYHDYNPFFSLIGGHSLCTLDFPWGHARIDEADFERYLDEIRPTEAALSLRFYRESLNRLTLGELRVAIADAGLELLAVIPWSDRTLVARLTPDILTEVRRTYPSAGSEDLLATFVAVLVRRPSEGEPGTA